MIFCLVIGGNGHHPASLGFTKWAMR